MKAVNLLPPDLRGTAALPTGGGAPASAPSGPGPFILLGALALAVVAAALYVLTANAVRQHEADLAAVSARQAAALQRAVALKPYADFKAVAENRVATVRDLANRRFDWEQALRDLSRAIPAEVTLLELEGTVASTSGGLRGAIAAPAVELKGCTSTQGAVARLMSRLRNVDGVTRVSLAKSTKVEVAGAGEPNALTAGADTAPCGTKDDPPGFELVAFFEGQADKSVAPTGPAPAATPAPGAVTAAATPGPAGAAPAATPQASTASASTAPGAPAP